MGCQGGRGTLCVLGTLLIAGLICTATAAASTISVADVQVTEAGVDVNATFTLTRQADALAGSATVTFQTVNSSAVAPADYVAASGSRTFGSSLFGGMQTHTVTVVVKGDVLDEASETFLLVLAGGEISDGDASATIADDDPPPSAAIADPAAVAEGAAGAHAAFVVRLSVPSGRSVSVAYATADAGATAGQDYAARAGTAVIAAGATQAAIDVALLDDGADEPAETFELRLSSPSAVAIADGAATATILDDDEPAPVPAPPPLPAAPAPKPVGAGTQAPSAAPAPAPASGSGASAGGAPSPAGPALGLSSPRLRRPSTVLVTVSCPQSAGRCSGRITIFSVPNRRSQIKALRSERKLGRVTFAVQGGRSQTLALALGRSDRRLLQRTGRMRVRAYALTRDSAGRTGVRSVRGTLIARTAHSSPSRP